MHAWTSMCTHVHVYTYARTRARSPVRIHARMHLHTHVLMCTYTRSYVNTLTWAEKSKKCIIISHNLTRTMERKKEKRYISEIKVEYLGVKAFSNSSFFSKYEKAISSCLTGGRFSSFSFHNMVRKLRSNSIRLSLVSPVTSEGWFNEWISCCTGGNTTAAFNSKCTSSIFLTFYSRTRFINISTNIHLTQIISNQCFVTDLIIVLSLDFRPLYSASDDS